MATINPNTPTYTQLFAPQVLANIATPATTTLDLKGKFGAWLITRMGRRVATALTRSAYLMVRSTDNNTIVVPEVSYDRVSSTGTAQSNTVASGGASGSNSVTLTSATGFVVGDTICLHSDDTSANRVEWARVWYISGNQLVVDRNFRTSHNAADRVTSQGDVSRIWLPGGDVWEFATINNSGQAMLFAADAIVYDSDNAA